MDQKNLRGGDSAKGTGAEESSVAGARILSASSEQEASRQLRQMFNRIAPTYDLLNHVLSFSFDHLWRRRTAERVSEILERSDARVLDLCCGTGDLTFAMERRARRRGAGRATGDRRESGEGNGAAVYGADFTFPMLTRAADKARQQRGAGGSGVVAPSQFLGSDALALPFRDATLDLVTVAFGFRNLSNFHKGLHEMARVLKAGGKIAILEFSEPRKGIAAAAFRFYFRHILPRVGGAISGYSQAYSYLPGSVAKFPSPEVFADWIRETGFGEVKFVLWNFGSVALHTGVKRG